MAGLEGRQLGDCEILAKLGQGGMGAVYKARQTELDRFVAIKVLPPQFASDEEFIARFKREAAAAARLTHPNIVQVYAAGRQDETHYFVMEFVDGESVQHRLQRKGRIDPEEALAICIHVSLGLDYAWRRSQLIHRDIKPDNIFLSKDAEVKLGDLGLAKSAGGPSSGLTITGAYMGTPYFVSPEQAQGLKEIDFRADIYSLGCTLYYMVSGRMPYESEGCSALQVILKHVHEPPPDILQAWPDCPVPLAELITTMIRKKPEDRYQSYAELIAAMKQVVAELHAGAAPRAAPHPKPAKRSAASPPDARKKPPAQEPAPVASPAPPKKAATPRESPSFAKIMGITSAASLVVLGAALYLGHSCGKPKVARTAAPIPPVATAGAETLEPGAIRLWDSPDKIPNQAGVRWENNALVLGDDSNGAKLVYTASKSRDAILRAEVRMVSSSCPEIGLRYDGHSQGQPDYRVQVDGKSKLIRLASDDNGKDETIKSWPLPRVYSGDEWMRIELRAVGDELTVLADGQLLGMAHDNRKLNAGGVYALHYRKSKAYFRNIIYVPLDKPGGGGAASPTAASGVDDAFVKEVAALPAEQQVARVAARLKDLNPGFDGNVQHEVADAAVVKLSFSTLLVSNISPVRALSGLKTLSCSPVRPAGSPPQRGLLTDLSPLRGLALTEFSCGGNEIKDLSPLKGMPLAQFNCESKALTDLSPLAGMPLTNFWCSESSIRDLSPLKGMPLQSLWLSGVPVQDLGPVADLPLRELMIAGTHVHDLSPLRGKPLQCLIINGVMLSDLSPLKGMPLGYLDVGNTWVFDLAPLRGMPLKGFRCNPEVLSNATNRAILQAIPTLETINDQPAAGFWK